MDLKTGEGIWEVLEEVEKRTYYVALEPGVSSALTADVTIPTRSIRLSLGKDRRTMVDIELKRCRI